MANPVNIALVGMGWWGQKMLAVLQAAEQLFARHGYAGTSLRAVMALADVDTGAIHYHFRNKLGLLKALFEQRCKTAGVVIHRTVKDVEGIELTKIRQPVPWGGKEYFDPMWPEAARTKRFSPLRRWAPR